MSQCPRIRKTYRNRGHGLSRRVSFWGLFQNTKQFPVHSIPKSNPSLAKQKKAQPTQPSSAMAAILARKSLQALRARQLQLVSFFSPFLILSVNLEFHFLPLSILNFYSYEISWIIDFKKLIFICRLYR